MMNRLKKIVQKLRQRKTIRNSNPIRILVACAGILGILGILLTGAYTSAGEVVDRIVAKVNDEIITLSELRERVHVINQELARNYEGTSLQEKLATLEKDVLDSMVEEILWVDQAKENGILVTDDDVDNAVKQIMERGQLTTAEQLETELANQGLTLPEYRDILRKQILIMRMKNTVSSGRVKVEEAEIQEYYDTHQDMFTSPDSVHVHQIFLPVSNPEQDMMMRTLAEKIIEDLRNGAVFCTMVKMYSIESDKETCGDLGFFRRGEMSPILEETAFSLKPGQFSDPVRSDYGYHILRTTEKRMSIVRSYDEVKNAIEQMLLQKKTLTKESEWIEQKKSAAYIELFL